MEEIVHLLIMKKIYHLSRYLSKLQYYTALVEMRIKLIKNNSISKKSQFIRLFLYLFEILIFTMHLQYAKKKNFELQAFFWSTIFTG